MLSIRSASMTLLLAVPTVSVHAAAAPLAAAPLSGIVRDEGGALLQGVEVLVSSPAGPGRGTFLSSVSDAGGRFLLAAVPPGVYQVAAVKTGYLASIARVNTVLRSSIDLVLRPVPRSGEAGAEKVQDDLSWTLRVPPHSILRDLEESAVLASSETSGARAFAARMQESLRGEVDHMVALGSWRPGASGGASSLEGNETRMRVGSALGERGAIQVRGRRGNFDSAAPRSTPGAVSRGTSDVDLDLSYDTSVDESLAMRAFYSSGDLDVTDRPGLSGGAMHQSQRSWGYDASWRKQVDASSRVALQVGYHDANLDLGPGDSLGWDAPQGDATNRAIGAEGSYENLVGNGHLVRVGVRAQRLSLSSPEARLGRTGGTFALDGASGWSVLVDSRDRWSLSGPFAVTYGLAVTQGFDGPQVTTVAPRIGGSWTAGRFEAKAEVSYVATTGGADPAPGTTRFGAAMPYGYDVELKTRLAPSLTVRGIATYLPSRAIAGGGDVPLGLQTLFVTDGFVSDRFVAVEVQRAAASATVSLGVARGRAEGALAPALDDVPIVLLAESTLDYGAVRFGVDAPRAGSSLALEYRALRDEPEEVAARVADSVRTIELSFGQDLVRFAGGRASCRLLLTARTPVGPGSVGSSVEASDARSFVADQKRIGAGVSLAF